MTAGVEFAAMDILLRFFQAAEWDYINFRSGGCLSSRVALVTSGVGTARGGIGVVAELMMSALRRDADVYVWQHPASWPRMVRIGLAYGRSLLGSFRRPDLVIYDHTHLAPLHNFIPSLRNIPYAVFLHGVEVWEPVVGSRREALRRASLLLANSSTTETAARMMNPWLPKPEVVWLAVRGQPNPTDLSCAPPVGLMVGRMSSSERLKGHDQVLDAWPEIRVAVPNARLLIVGTGDDLPRLRRRVRDEHISGIEFRGRLDDAERDRLYRSSRLLFFPSRQEGFGIVAAEAASFGVPILGLRGTVIEELFPDNTGICLADSWASHDLARAAIPVLADSRLAGTLGKAAWARVRNNFLEEHFAKRFRRALRNLLPAFGESCKDTAESLQAGTN
jgi:phosphatidylinositol alpha-1,6-mannosyltransferase